MLYSHQLATYYAKENTAKHNTTLKHCLETLRNKVIITCIKKSSNLFIEDLTLIRIALIPLTMKLVKLDNGHCSKTAQQI